jgi:hypothetical protein
MPARSLPGPMRSCLTEAFDGSATTPLGDEPTAVPPSHWLSVPPAVSYSGPDTRCAANGPLRSALHPGGVDFRA